MSRLIDIWPIFGLVVRTPRLELRLPRDEARIGLLTLTFDHLGAKTARTDVFQDNHASQGVSRKLGYEPDGISVDARGNESLISDRLRLSRATWKARTHPPVTLEGVSPCLPLFGL
jgi:hypothetical protein